jgi:hypothetical protein
MEQIPIRSTQKSSLLEFLELREFLVENLGDGIYKVTRDEELPVFLRIGDGNIFFEVDLGNIDAIASQDLYFQLLDLNTEILPVSLGIDNSNTDDPRLVLVERRETGDLCDEELLCVFDALELAVDRAAEVLQGAVSAA